MTEERGWTVECKVAFTAVAKGRKRLREREEAPSEPEPFVAGRVPRISRLLALAHRFEGLVASGEMKDFAEVGRLAGISRPRVTQIMNLLHLAPDIQEALLDLPRTAEGRDPVTEREVRGIAAEPVWGNQRSAWNRVVEAAG